MGLLAGHLVRSNSSWLPNLEVFLHLQKFSASFKPQLYHGLLSEASQDSPGGHTTSPLPVGAHFCQSTHRIRSYFLGPSSSTFTFFLFQNLRKRKPREHQLLTWGYTTNCWQNLDLSPDSLIPSLVFFLRICPFFFDPHNPEQLLWWDINVMPGAA